MKNYLLIILLFVAFQAQGQDSTLWQNNFEQAQKQCLEKDQKLLLVFSGSDWCKPCIRLKSEILDTPEFRNEVKGKWLLYNADFPYRTKLLKEKVKENEALAETYNPEGKFPKVVLLDGVGNVLAVAGYKNVSPHEYVEFLLKQVK